MRKFYITIEFTKDYLQARYSEANVKATSQSVKKSGTEGIKVNDPKDMLWEDEKGIYIPAEHFEGALGNSGKDFKVKSRRINYANYIKARTEIVPRRIYLNKKEMIDSLFSAVKRKDGSRTPVKHPVVCKAGEKVKFALICNEDGIDTETLKAIMENAGSTYGVGGRRPKWGQFTVVEFNEGP